MPNEKHADGFTLIELITTISISAILLTMGLPNFSRAIKNNRLTTQINAFSGALYLARSEAIKRNRRVTVCKSVDSASCTTNNNWDQGWIVFVDPNNNASVDVNEEIIQIYAALKPQNSLSGNANVDDYISYVSTGMTQRLSGAFQNGSVTLCDDRIGDFGKKLVLNNAGRIRIDTGITCP